MIMVTIIIIAAVAILHLTNRYILQRSCIWLLLRCCEGRRSWVS